MEIRDFAANRSFSGNGLGSGMKNQAKVANRVVETLHLVVETFELRFHERSIGIF